MTYGQLKRQVLQLMGRWSVAGRPLESSYNDQDDYLQRIPGLVNDALVYIAGSARRIPAQQWLEPGEGVEWGAYRRFTLPEDCMSVRGGGALSADGQRELPVRVLEPDHVLLPRDMGRGAVLEYYRRPQLLPQQPGEDQSVDGEADVLAAAGCYAAAMLLLEDDPFRYSALYNEFERRVQRLMPRELTEWGPVTDVYGFGEGGVGA